MGFVDVDAETGESTDVYVLTDYSFENAQYFPGNRDRDSLEKTSGLTLKADWENEDWLISGKLLRSSSESFRINAQFDARYQPIDNRADNSRTNGITGRLTTGNGNIADYQLQLNGFENLSLDREFSYDVRGSDNQPNEILARQLSRSSVNARGTNEDGSEYLTRLLVVGGETFHDREVDTARFDVTRNLEFAGIDRIKFGAYKSTENFERRVNRNTPAFINLENISNDLLQAPESSFGNPFFEGTAPGAIGADGGWRAIDVDAAVAALTPGIQERYNEQITALENHITVEAGNTANDALTDAQKEEALDYYRDATFTSLGFLERRRATDVTSDFESEIDINEAYLMAEFSGDFGAVPVFGNIGVRYVETTNGARGLQQVDNNGGIFDRFETVKIENSYTNVLPSFNIGFELRDDLVLRGAYYEGIVRPNAAAFAPSNDINETERRVNIDVSDTELQPFTADSYDLSLSWYNRSGSVFSVGYFRKDVQQAATREVICPADASAFGLGSLFVEEGSNLCLETAVTQVTTTDDSGAEVIEDVNREVNIEVPRLAESSKLEGYEVTVQQNLDFLPGFWKHFGGQLNLSKVTVDGEPIPNVSELAYNSIIYFETDKFTTRLLYNFRDDYTLTANGTFDGNVDRDAKSRERLDLQVGYKFSKKFSVTLRGFNLLNTTFQEFQAGNPSLGRRTAYDGRIYSAQASMKF